MSGEYSCVGCAYAEWQKTKNGRLHPSGDGRCTHKCELPILARSMRLTGGFHLAGGWIERKKGYDKPCPVFTKDRVQKVGDAHKDAPCDLSEYSSSQWWFKELEALFITPVGGGVTADMKRAAHIAMDLMTAVEEQRSSPG